MTPDPPRRSRPDVLVGGRIRVLRVLLGLSQRELANNADGVSYAYVSRVEAGARTPSWRALIEVATPLETSALYLARGDDKATCPVCERDGIGRSFADVRKLRAALKRAHDALDADHGHTVQTWIDRQRERTLREGTSPEVDERDHGDDS